MSRTYAVIEERGQFEGMRAEWNALLDSSGIASPFLTWEWLYTWWEYFGVDDRKSRLAIIVERDGEALTAIYPGYIKRERIGGQGVNVFAFLGNRYESTDYLEMIHQSPQDVEALARMFREIAARKELNIDLIEMINVLEDRPFLQAAQMVGEEIGGRFVCRHHRTCPHIPVSGDWDSFMAGLSKNMRYNVRRRSRNMFEKNDAQFGWITDVAEIDAAVDELFDLHERRFESKNADTIFRGEGRQQFHRAVSRRFLDRDILKFSRLQVAGKNVAMLYSFQFANEFFYFQAGMDPEWEKQSAGLVLMAQNVQYTHDEGLARFDFMRGDEAYKFKWTSHVRNMVHADLAVSSRGRNALSVREAVTSVKEAVKERISEETWNKIKNLNPL